MHAPTGLSPLPVAPQLVAASWARVRVAAHPVEAQQRALDTLQVLLRYLAAMALADALQGGVERDLLVSLVQPLRRPSLGHWAQLLRRCTIGNRNPFVPELPGILLARRRKPSKVLRDLDDLVALRNRIAHSPGADSPPTEVAERLQRLLDALAPVLDYSPVRVLDTEPTRSGQTQGTLQRFVGEAPLTPPVGVTWSANLLQGVVYLASPDGTRMLEVSPLLSVRRDPAVREERCMLVASIGHRVVVEAPQTGSTAEAAATVHAEEASVDAWLREGTAQVHGMPSWRTISSSPAAPTRRVTPAHPVPPPPSGMARPPGRWLPWVGGGLAALCLGIVAVGAVGWAWTHPTYETDGIVTIDQAPVLYDDPEHQARFEAVHEAFVADEVVAASQRIRPLLEHASIPPETLFFAFFLEVRGALPPTMASTRLERMDVERLGESSATVECVSFLRIASTMGEQDGAARKARGLAMMLRLSNGVQRWLGSHPHDVIAATCGMLVGDPTTYGPTLDRLDPDGEAAFVTYLRLGATADPIEHRTLAEAAHRANPTSMPRAAAAAMAQRAVDPELARATIDAALEDAPASLLGHVVAAGVALSTGDEAELRRHIAFARSPEWREAVQPLLEAHILGPAIRRGRPRLAVEQWTLLDVPHANPPLLHATHAFYADLYDAETVRLALQKANQALVGQAPSPVVASLRWAHGYQRDKLRFQLMLREAPDDITAEMLQSVQPGRFSPDDPAHVVAAWKGDPEPYIAAAAERLPADGATWEVVHCAAQARLGTMLVVSGHPARAIPAWQAIVDHPVCETANTMPERAIAHGRLALAALQVGDHEKAERHLTIFRQLWPRPEPTVPLVRALHDAKGD